MAVGPYAWSTTALTNGAADANINWAEGSGFKMPDINNSARAMMAALRGWIDGLGGGASFGGAANAYTITNSSVAAWSAYAAGQIVALKIPAAAGNTGASTVNVDALGVKSIVTSDGGALVSGDLVAGGVYLLAYDGTNFQVLNTIAGGSYQPLDADLTAIAALGYTSGAYIIKKTAADTWALIAITSAGEDALVNYTAADVMSKLLTVDGAGSGLDADLLDGANLAEAATASTVVKRSSNGSISAYDVTASRGNATGAIYFGDQSGGGRYLYCNGSQYIFADAEIAVSRSNGQTAMLMYNSNAAYNVDLNWRHASVSGDYLASLRTGGEFWFYKATGGVFRFLPAGTTVVTVDSTGIKDASSNILKSTGKTTIPVPASAMIANTTNGAAAGVYETTTNGVMYRTLDFDQTTQEGAQFLVPMPKSWNEGTVTFEPIWTAGSGAGGVVFELRALALSNDDVLDAAFGTGQTSTDTLIAAGDVHIGPESSAITIAGTPAEGDLVIFQVRRNVAAVSDTLTADARLIAIKLHISLAQANDV